MPVAQATPPIAPNTIDVRDGNASPVSPATTSGSPTNTRSRQFIYVDPTSVRPVAVRSAPIAADPQVAGLVNEYCVLDREVLGLVAKAKETQVSTEKARLHEQIQELVSRQFRVRQELRQAEVERLRKRLEEAEQLIYCQQQLTVKIVERRVADLLDADSATKWEPLTDVTEYGGPDNSLGAKTYSTAIIEEQVLPDGTHVEIPKTVTRENLHNGTPHQSTSAQTGQSPRRLRNSRPKERLC